MVEIVNSFLSIVLMIRLNDNAISFVSVRATVPVSHFPVEEELWLIKFDHLNQVFYDE